MVRRQDFLRLSAHQVANLYNPDSLQLLIFKEWEGKEVSSMASFEYFITSWKGESYKVEVIKSRCSSGNSFTFTLRHIKMCVNKNEIPFHLQDLYPLPRSTLAATRRNCVGLTRKMDPANTARSVSSPTGCRNWGQSTDTQSTRQICAEHIIRSDSVPTDPAATSSTAWRSLSAERRLRHLVEEQRRILPHQTSLLPLLP